MRQVVYAGTSLWSRDSTDIGGTTWPAAWGTQTYATAWGSNATPPPTTHVDAVTMRVFFNDNNLVRHHMRQTIYSGTSFWYRDSTDNNGTSWPTTWVPISYASSWGSNPTPPPTDHVDSVVIRPLYDSSGRQTSMQQAIYCNANACAGVTSGKVWYRTSTDRAGTTWPANWSTMDYATAWAGSTGTAPSSNTISEVVFRPVYNGSGTLTSVRQTVYASNMYYTRDSTTPTEGAWGAWTSGTYASSWGSNSTPPPTTSIDAFMSRPLFATGSTLVAPAPPSSSPSKPGPIPQSLSSQTLPLQTRVITYAYDGLQRLVGANESPGTSYAYAYDNAGNRTGVWVNGTRTVTQTFNAANQVNGLSYDAAGNLTNDGSATYGYDALNRMAIRGTTPYIYNGDGVLVFDGTTRYSQDLATPLSQVLQTTQGSATTDYLYGLDRLAAVAGSTRTWYGYDALGSVRQTLSDSGAPLGVVNYDPWGTVEGGSVPVFGFTGEVQDAATGLVNLRARWYATGQGRFVSRDAFAGDPAVPSSQHPYQYGYSDPVLNTDPSGRCSPMADRQRDPCWLVYNKVLDQLSDAGPDNPPPANLITWETPVLQNLLTWMQDGIRFTPQGNTQWTAGAMQAVLDGLRRVDHYFGGNRSRTKNALGLNQGTLELVLNQAEDKGDGKGGGAFTHVPGNTIELQRLHPEVYNERVVQTFVHELGHIVDQQALRVTGIGADSLWSRDPHGPWELASGWGLNSCAAWFLSEKGRRGGVSAYAVGGANLVLGSGGDPLPEEDFAETFNWVIEKANGYAFWPSGGKNADDQRNPFRDPGLPTELNQERKQVVEDLLNQF